MTLGDALELQDGAPTPPAEQFGGWILERPVLSNLAEAVGLGLAILLLVGCVLGVYAGIVYWSIQASLWGVILSAIVPGFGAVSILPLLIP